MTTDNDPLCTIVIFYCLFLPELQNNRTQTLEILGLILHDYDWVDRLYIDSETIGAA